MFTFQEGLKQGAVKEINFSLMANVSFVPEGLCFHIYVQFTCGKDFTELPSCALVLLTLHEIFNGIT